MSERKPFFVSLPWEFLDEWLTDRRVKQTHVLSALYIARRCFETINTSGGVAPIELSTLARLCDRSTETIRRTLHDLRAWGWIDFETGDGGDPAWRIWLTGLALDTTSPRPLHKNTPQSVESPLHTPDGADGHKPALEEGFDPHDLSTKALRALPTDDTRRNERSH